MASRCFLNKVSCRIISISLILEGRRRSLSTFGLTTCEKKMATKYRPLSEDIDDSRFSSDDIAEQDTFLTKIYGLPKHDKRPSYTTWLLAALLAVSICCNAVALFWRRSSGDLDDICSRYTSQNREQSIPSDFEAGPR